MQRRGPDDVGAWQDGRCAFGFRRLSILDLFPTGHQPMLSQDGRYVLVFNGELYNFQEIRSELEQRGVSFRSTGDAEVVLYALTEWGISALGRFNGMFGLAFFDIQAQTLLLARDHAGIKPLYYLHTKQGLVFASQYNQIVGHTWARSLEVSQAALSLYLRFGWIPAPYALLENTHLLEAGCWLRIDSTGNKQEGRFYEFPRFTPPTLHGEQAVDALDEALDRAVRRHLISDVPVGVFLSGGIDSPLVAAKARQISGQRMQVFTIGVTDPAMDESEDAAAYAQEIDLEHILRMIDEQAALDLLNDVAQASTELTADFSMFPTLLVSQLASHHVKVVLTGDGGDELFWGYPGRFVPMMEQAPYFRIPRPLRLANVGARKILGIGKATREVLWPDLGRLFQKKHTLLAETDLEALFPDLQPIPQDLGLFKYTGTDLEETAQWLRWNEFNLHLARVLMKADRASMHFSLETRLPLLDKEVLAVAAQTDWRTCLDIEKRLGKIPLRKVLKRHVRHRTLVKKGFTVPMHEWLQGPLQGLLQEKVLHRPDFLGQPVNQAHLAKLNQQLLYGDRSKAWGLWLLLSLILWEETHFQL
jgi:asparagine synthase (glutamine-hydrolysing)